MKKLIPVIVLLATTACSAPNPYESVTIRIGELSCSERLVFDHRQKTGLDVTKYGDNVNTALNVDLGGLGNIATSSPHEPEQRCEDILQIAEEYMRAKLDIIQTEAAKDRSDLKRTEAKDLLEIERIKNSSLDITTEW